MTTKTEVIDQAIEFLVKKFEGVQTGITFQMEDAHALYFDGIFESKIEKEDGYVSFRLTGNEDWVTTDFEWNGYRTCTKCNSLMIEGYCIFEGENYFCSDKCLHTEHTKEDYERMYADGEGDSYYTSWENE